MKRLLFFLAVVLALSSCTTVYNLDGKKQWVYDSYWNLVMMTPAAKDITVVDSGDIPGRIEAWRAANPTIQVFVEDEETPIEESPLAVVWIVDAITHNPIKAFIDVPRTSFVENAVLWDYEARADGGVMYVDVVPPPPAPIDPTYKYFIYLIAENGSILFETQTTPDLFYLTLQSYNQEAYNHLGSHVVSGELYNG